MIKQDIYTHTDEATRVNEGIIAIYSNVSDTDWAKIPQLCSDINEYLGLLVSVTITGYTPNNYEIFFIMDAADSTLKNLEEATKFIGFKWSISTY